MIKVTTQWQLSMSLWEYYLKQYNIAYTNYYPRIELIEKKETPFSGRGKVPNYGKITFEQKLIW